jgi:hypothetical protein
VPNIEEICKLLEYNTILKNKNNVVNDRNDFMLNVLSNAHGIINSKRNHDRLLFVSSGHGVPMIPSFLMDKKIIAHI